jgi:NADPH:quinone reductase
MRAIVVESPGSPDRLRLRELPRPEPGPGEALIAVAFAGCNWSDIQKRSGIYPDPVNYPIVLGGEVSGCVAAVGPLTRGVTVGDRVAAMTGPHCLGGYAELVSVPAPYLIRLPVGFPLDLGAAFPMVTLTAYHLVHSAYQVRRNEFVLVHAIGGSVGLMLTQMLKMVGARVMGTVGRPGKGDRAKALGADLVVDRSCEDFVAAAHEFTGGRGIDLVIDSLGSDVLERSFDTLRTYGHVINIGEAAGYPDFPIRPKLYERSTSLAGFEVMHARPGSARWRRGVRFAIDGLASGQLQLPIEGVLPLEEAAAMHHRLEQRGVSGKLLLEVGQIAG